MCGAVFVTSLSSTKQRLIARSGCKFTNPVLFYEQLKSVGRTTSQQRYASKVTLWVCRGFWYLVNLVSHHYYLCGLLTVERAWSRDHAASMVTAVLPPPGQRCGTVCLNSFGNRTSPSDNSNDRWKCWCLVRWATAPCVWTLRALIWNLLTYLLTYMYTRYASLFTCLNEICF